MEVKYSGCPTAISRLRVRKGQMVTTSSVLCTLSDTDANGEERKILSKYSGKITAVLKKEGDSITERDCLVRVEVCKHDIVIKDLCAECGENLRATDGMPGERRESATASVAMVHNIPELYVSEEKANELADEETSRLLKNRKLVLLIDLDQTLIHTTCDDVPIYLKDVHHFQLPPGGPGSPYYHTKLRPGTMEFLEKMSEYFELHIITFGNRLYAHTIAGIIDPQTKFFGHRILSRDEAFNPLTKTANLKSLFPRGDSMVCIIDDRAEVWSFSKHLIHVKPYKYFRDTEDINLPGQDINHRHRMSSRSTKRSKHHKSKRAPSKERQNKNNNKSSGDGKRRSDDKTKKEENTKEEEYSKIDDKLQEFMDDEAEVFAEKEAEKASPSHGSADKEKEEKSDVVKEGDEEEKANDIERKSDDDRLAGVTEKSEDPKEKSEDANQKSESTEKSEAAEKSEDANQKSESTEKSETAEKSEDANQKSESTEKSEDASKEAEEPNEKSEEVNEKSERSVEKSEEVEEKWDELADEASLDAPFNDWKDEDPWIDKDDYLLHLSDILRRIHTAFYAAFDARTTDELPDLKEIIPQLRARTLRDTRLVFSGVVPLGHNMQQSGAFHMARQLGAEVHDELQTSGSSRTNYVIASRAGTRKVSMARKAKVRVVSPHWIWESYYQWRRLSGRDFRLEKDYDPDSFEFNDRKRPLPPAEEPGSKCRRNEEPAPDNHSEEPMPEKSQDGDMDVLRNPLMQISPKDTLDMEDEVEEAMQDEDTSSDEDNTLFRLGNISSSSASSSEDSLSGADFPKGWRPQKSSGRSVSSEEEDREYRTCPEGYDYEDAEYTRKILRDDLSSSEGEQGEQLTDEEECMDALRAFI